MAAVHLAGWRPAAVEIALALLAYSSHGGEGLPSWCHERMSAWDWRNSLELVLLLDYLLVPAELLHVISTQLSLVVWRNGLAAAVQPAAICLTSLPQLLQLPFARSLHPDLWFELMTSPLIIQLQGFPAGLAGDVSVWLGSYTRFLAAAVQWSRRDDNFRCYGPITGRDLSMRPPALQVFLFCFFRGLLPLIKLDSFALLPVDLFPGLVSGLHANGRTRCIKPSR